MVDRYKVYITLLSLINVCCCSGETLLLKVDTVIGYEFIEYERNNSFCQTIGSSSGEQCKYYGECCQDPVRIRERLVPGTFECINIGITQGYVVTRCPVGTGEELFHQCAQGVDESKTDTSLGQWPVTGTYTGITYSNMYCAICNGALSPVTDNDLTDSFDPEKALEFWTLKVHCKNSTIEEIVNKELFDIAQSLQQHLQNSNCWKVMVPTKQGIHKENCGRDINKCPEEYPPDGMKELCDHGPINEVCIDGSPYPCLNGAYKNMFCKKCWEKYYHKELKPLPRRAEVLLMAARLTTQKFRYNSQFSDDNYRYPEVQPDHLLSATNDDFIYWLKKPFKLSEAHQFWNLGSVLCYSEYDMICDKLLVYPKESNSCSDPGCGVGSTQDLHNNCTKINAYSHNSTIVYSTNFQWADFPLAAIFNGCQGKNCRCDSRCHYFNDCCFDAPPPFPFFKEQIKPLDQSGWTCHDLYSDGNGIIVINSCPEDAAEAALCTRGNIGGWDIYSWLVSDSLTLLTYKNMYCASCNNATNLVFWDAIMDCPVFSGQVQGVCDFVAFTPPAQHENLYYPCYLDDVMIATCPETYKNWQLYQDCKNQPASYVYYGKETYRNFYCALCNLGDDMEFATIFPSEKSPRYNLLKVPSMPELGEVQFFGWQMIRFSYNKRMCCGKCDRESAEKCTSIGNRDNAWGNMTIPGVPGCSDVPFQTSCLTDFTESEDILLRNTMFSYLCPGVTITCKAFGATTPIYINNSNSNHSFGSDSTGSGHPDGEDFTTISYSTDFALEYSTKPTRPPKAIQIILSPNTARSNKKYVDTTSNEWVLTANESFQFCSDGTIISNTSGESVNKIMLTNNGIQVNTIVVIKTPIPEQKVELEMQDFILIGISLAAITAYLLLMCVAMKRPFSLPDKMMIALLVSLWGALICFAFVTTPAGSNVIACQAVAALTQFFFLSTLTWSSSMAISIIKSLYSFSLSRQSSTFNYYFIYSFGLPLFCVTLTYFLSTADLDLAEEVYETEVMCFLGDFVVICCLFLGPMYLMIFCNFVIGVIVMVKVAKSGKVGVNRDKNLFTKHVISCLKITLSLGLAWVFLFFARFIPGFWPIMQAFVELQGLLVVLSKLIGWSCVRKIKNWMNSSPAGSNSNIRSSRPSSSPNISQHTESVSLSPSNPAHNNCSSVTEFTYLTADL